MINIQGAAEYFAKESVFVFTTDIDFSPEWAIEETLKAFHDLEVPLTPFTTHPSDTIKRYYGAPEMRRYVGLHPYSGRTLQGNGFEQIIHTLRKMWPEARTVRNHSYRTLTREATHLCKIGFQYDCDLCLLLQPYCTPLRHCSGMTRFPTWWEDDVHMAWKHPLKLDELKGHLELPGMKIIDTHPLLFALNKNKYTKDMNDDLIYYTDPATSMWVKTTIKSISNSNWAKHIMPGDGVKQLVTDMIEYIKSSGYTIMYLDDLYESLKKL